MICLCSFEKGHGRIPFGHADDAAFGARVCGYGGVFARENPHLPREAMYHTFLLDEENRVVLVGDPSRNERIKELFWQIVEEKSGKRE